MHLGLSKSCAMALLESQLPSVKHQIIQSMIQPTNLETPSNQQNPTNDITQIENNENDIDETVALPMDDDASQEVIDSFNDSNCSRRIPGMFGISYTTSQYVETKLLKILNDINAPRNTYQDIMNWIKEAKQMQYSFAPTFMTRNAQVNHLEQ